MAEVSTRGGGISSMSIFLVVPLEDDEEKYRLALENVGGDVFKLQKGGFLVRFDGTTKELSEKAGIAHADPANDGPPRTGSALITLVGNYWGYGNADMWEWLATRWGR